MERYRRTRGQHLRREEGDFWKIKFIRQCIVCTVIFAAVFAIGLLKTETAESISKNIRRSISYTVDYRSAVKDIFSSINEFTRGADNGDNQKTDSAD